MSNRPDQNESLAEILVEVPTEHLDLVTDLITGDFETGIELRDENDEGLTGIVYYAPLTVYDDQLAILRKFFTRLGNDVERCRLSSRIINNVEWVEAYRNSVKAIRIEPDILVRPPWVQPEDDIRYDIVIEPKMAFGTGTHETTRSCLRVIRDRFRSGLTFLDLGCGSGILSILADKLGASYIKAIDYDLLAVDNSVENFEGNGVTARNDILHGSIDKCAMDKPYDFVCANIIKSAILEMLDQIVATTSKTGILVLSGLLYQDLDDVVPALRQLGVDEFDTIEDGEWRTLVIDRTR